MPVIRQKMIFRQDLRSNPHVLYLFGDNDMRTGYGGQAKQMRDEPNAVGIRTKRAPWTGDNAYWSDINYQDNLDKIEEDLDRVGLHLALGKVVVVPMDGIGTGLSEMEDRCPKTFKYLQDRLNNL